MTLLFVCAIMLKKNFSYIIMTENSSEVIMKLFYDLHLHSCLSPCGDNEMTPYNLVNMAKVLGFDIIALTDHNSTKNCRAAVEAGKKAGLTVVPGMELCTSEEIHVVCLFKTVEGAESFGSFVRENIPEIKNRPHIFGEQFVMDSEDTVLESEELLLTAASFLSVDAVPGAVKKFGGVCFPAHIDRSSYSIISALGAFPEELCVSCFELTPDADEAVFFEKYPVTKHKLLLRNSDAHYLENMRFPENTLDLPENSAKALVEYLENQENTD